MAAAGQELSVVTDRSGVRCFDMTNCTPSQPAVVRPLYQRLMRRRGGTLNTEAEVSDLTALLHSAPGASQVKVLGWHRKGGYEVGLTLIWAELDAFIAHLEAHNWMSVI